MIAATLINVNRADNNTELVKPMDFWKTEDQPVEDDTDFRIRLQLSQVAAICKNRAEQRK